MLNVRSMCVMGLWNKPCFMIQHEQFPALYPSSLQLGTCLGWEHWALWWTQCPVPAQEGCRAAGVGPEEGHEDAQRAEAGELRSRRRNQLFTQSDSDRTTGNGFILTEGRCRLDVKNKFFTQRSGTGAVLPREAVGAPSPEVLKAGLYGALGSLSWWLATSPWQEVGTGWALQSPPTQPFCDSMILW